MLRAPRIVLIEPGGERREVIVSGSPFRIGRQAGGELVLRDNRISRQQAQIVAEGGKFFLEDLGSRHGTFVNGKRIQRHELAPQDAIDFGVPDSYRMVYMGDEATLGELLQRVETPVPAEAGSRELYHLGVLLEVARVLHTGMSLEEVLTAVVDAAVRVTRTERGVLLLRNPDGSLRPAVARDARGATIEPAALEISQSVLRRVAESRREMIITDTGDDTAIAQQASVVRLALHTIVAIPLEKMPVMGSGETTVVGRPSELIGVLYLDSHSPGNVVSELDREVLRSLALEAATVVENARLFAAARAKEQIDHQMRLASEIQQKLLPKTFPVTDFCTALGMNIACDSVGGDFYDVIDLGSRRYGVVVADVAGKGISAALLATMLQGVFCATAGMDIALDTIVERVNRYLCARSGEERYATLFYGVLDHAGRLDYINAGHVPPLIRSADGTVRSLSANNLPVGMFEAAEYQSDRVQLAPGDFLVVFTDGITEAANTAEELFGDERLRQTLERFPGGSLEDLSRAIREAVRTFTAGASQSDDFTLVILHYTGKPA